MREIKSIMSAARGLQTRNVNFNQELQELLVDCIEYAFGDDKNCSPLTDLLIQEGKLRFNGIASPVLFKWLCDHAPVRWDEKKCVFKFNKNFAGVFDREYLLAKAWWDKEKKAPNIIVARDMIDELTDLVSRLSKFAGKQGNTLANANLLGEVQTLLNNAKYAEAESAIQAS